MSAAERLLTVAQAKGRVSVNFTRDACPPFVGYRLPVGGQQAAWCEAFNRDALARARGVRTIVLAGMWTGYDVRGIEPTLRALKGHRILIVGPTPTLAGSVPDCLRAHDIAACGITRQAFEAAASGPRATLKALAARYGAQYVEPADFFCTETTCPAVRDGVALYWDNKHVSSSAVQAFARLH